MFKVLITTITLLGSVSFAAEVHHEQLLSEVKADVIATCITKRAQIQKMVSDPTPITAQMCEELAEQLLSGSSPRSINQVVEMILQRKEDKAGLKKMKQELLTMEQRFDHLQIETVIARPALVNLINKLVNN
ncbi:MAG: hypothetical protein KF681_04895 [Bdellovibrionaceae bacterium]|nr:hypothetical protein [Pseudobdellovibrionaceae bacterium]